MGLLSWLFKPPATYLTQQEVMMQPASLDINPAQSNLFIDSFEFGIVGESNYQFRINTYAPDDLTKQDKFKFYFIATLSLENDNEFDKKAVRVSFNNGTIGYLDKESARLFRKKRSKLNDSSSAWTVRAVAVGGKNKNTGIWLNYEL